MIRRLAFVFSVCAAACSHGVASDHPSEASHPGWTALRSRPFLPPDFDQQTFDHLWRNWAEPERARAEAAELDERRRLIADYYGLTLNPFQADGAFNLLGYVKTSHGWCMNCLVCHSGEVDGQIVPGLGNNRLALQTLTEDVRRTKLLRLQALSHLDMAILKLPLNTTNGTSNAVMFGVVLGAKRRLDMSVDSSRSPPPLVHHDMDAPPWWRLKKKSRLYADGFAPKTHRAIMQFMLLPENDRETVLGWEDDFEQILAWMQTIEPPPYRGVIDSAAADRGRGVFGEHCSSCHGTYGEQPTYPELVVPLDEVKTDPVRLNALATEHRVWMRDSWMSRFGEDHVEINPEGYVAPPLDGIWATAPYLHNGSVPTLEDLLNPAQRPTVCRMTSKDYDHQKLGVTVERLTAVPPNLPDRERRWYFDTSQLGKSNVGHDFGAVLTESERVELLEYLKTL